MSADYFVPTGDVLYDSVCYRFVVTFFDQTQHDIGRMKTLISMSNKAIQAHKQKHKTCDECSILRMLQNENGENTIMERLASASVAARQHSMFVEGYDVGVPFGRLYDMHPGWERDIRLRAGI